MPTALALLRHDPVCEPRRYILFKEAQCLPQYAVYYRHREGCACTHCYVPEMTELVAKLTSAIEASPPDEAAIAEVLDALEGWTMTMDLLKTTGVGKVVNSLKRKSELAALAGRARALVDQWKALWLVV